MFCEGYPPREDEQCILKGAIVDHDTIHDSYTSTTAFFNPSYMKVNHTSYYMLSVDWFSPQLYIPFGCLIIRHPNGIINVTAVQLITS